MSASIRSVAVRGATYAVGRLCDDASLLVLIEPKLRGQPDSLQLAGRSLRQLVEKHDAMRHLVVGDQLRRVIPDLDLRRHVPRPKHYGGGNLLAKAMVGDCKRDRLRHRGMGAQDLVNLARRNLLAAAIDHLLETPGDEQVAVRIDGALVAGAKPSVDERRPIRFRILRVTRRHARSAQNDFADFTGREQIAGLVHQRDFGSRRDSNRTGLARAGRCGIGGNLMRRLGHPIGFDHGNLEGRLHLGHQLRSQCR